MCTQNHFSSKTKAKNCVLNRTKNSSKRVSVHQRGTKNLKNLQLKASVHAKPLSTLCWCSFALLAKNFFVTHKPKTAPFSQSFCSSVLQFSAVYKSLERKKKNKTMPCHGEIPTKMMHQFTKWYKVPSLKDKEMFLFSLILFLPLLSMIAVSVKTKALERLLVFKCNSCNSWGHFQQEKSLNLTEITCLLLCLATQIKRLLGFLKLKSNDKTKSESNDIERGI